MRWAPVPGRVELGTRLAESPRCGGRWELGDLLWSKGAAAKPPFQTQAASPRHAQAPPQPLATGWALVRCPLGQPGCGAALGTAP